MRKLQFIALLLSSIFSRYRFLLLFVLFVILVAIYIFSYYLPIQTQPVISEGIIGIFTPDTLPYEVTNLLSDPLVSLDQEASPQARLASNWEVYDDATLYTFHLKDNLMWNDGSKLKSSDIKFNLTDVEAKFLDDQTIQFKLPDSFGLFPSLLTSPVLKDDTLIGTGNYKISYQEMSQRLVSKLILTPLKPSLPQIAIRFYPDEQTATTAFNLGEVNSLLNVSSLDNFSQIPNVKIKKQTDYSQIVAIFYNTQDPILSDKNFRRALSYASPKIAGQEWAKTSISPHSWAYDDQVRDYLNNPTEAKNSLDKVAKGQDQTITLTTTSRFSSLGDQIIQAWKAIGINAVLRVESGSPQNFQSLLTTQAIPSDPDQYALWHSTQADTNLSKYKSDRVDKDLEDGRKTADQKVRQEKYFDFQKNLLDDSPATFLYFPTFNVVYRSKVGQLLDQVLPLELSHNVIF